MRKYPIISSNGVAYNASHIGINHTIRGISIESNISSYDKTFDNEDEVVVDMNSSSINYGKIGNIKEAYKMLKDEIIAKRPTTLEGYSECVRRVVSNYFGDFSKVKTRLSYFPSDEDIAYGNKKMGQISNIAHKNVAMGVERAMLAQNLLMEIGIKSIFKTSSTIINDKEFIHAFNLINHDKKYYIYDVTIPMLKDDKISALICEIPKEVFDKISKPNNDIGYSVSLSHFNPFLKDEINITYDAGREETYRIEKPYTK